MSLSTLLAKPAALLAGTGLLLVGIAGCSAPSAETPTTDRAPAALSVPAANLVSTIGTQLKQQKVAVDSGSLSCPGALDAAVGKSVSCQFTTSDQPVTAMATVTEVDGTTVGFDITVEAQPVPAAVLAKAVQKQLAGAYSTSIDSVTCAGDLQPTLGKTASCTVTAGGETSTVVARTFTVDGGLINFTVDSF